MTSTLQDDRIAGKLESVFNTPVTVDRWCPWVDGTNAKWDPRIRQSMGVQGGGGRRAPLGARNYATIGQGTFTIKYEMESKQAGFWLNWALGVSTVTAITGGSQQVFHDSITGTTLPSATFQFVEVRNDATEYIETYSGCTATKVTFECPEDDIVTMTAEGDARSLTTATGAASQAYATNPVLFDHYQASSTGLAGSFTAPTTTALATGPTAFADFRSWKLDIDHATDTDRRIVGGRNQPTAGYPKIGFSGVAEFNAVTLPNGLIAGTKFPWQTTFTTTEALSAGFTQLQFAVPSMVLSKDLPQVKPGETRLMSVDADVVNDLSNRDFYVVYRTTDTAL